jgi:hypothetical protein
LTVIEKLPSVVNPAPLTAVHEISVTPTGKMGLLKTVVGAELLLATNTHVKPVRSQLSVAVTW